MNITKNTLMYVAVAAVSFTVSLFAVKSFQAHRAAAEAPTETSAAVESAVAAETTAAASVANAETSAPAAKPELTGDAKLISELDPKKPDSIGAVSLKQLSEVEVIAPMAREITDEDVRNNINFVLGGRTVEAKEVQDGYTTNIDFKGFVDGKEFEGGTAEAFDYQIGGSKKLIEGFEAGLMDMKPGDTKTLKLKFPEDYAAAELAGKDVEFEVKLNSIARPMKAEDLTDDFSKEASNGAYNTVEELKQGMREELEKSEAKAVGTILAQRALDAVVAQSETKISEEAIEWIIDMYAQYYDKSLKAAEGTMGLADYLEMSDLNYTQFREQLTKDAETQAIKAAVANEIAAKAGLEYNEEALVNYLEEFGYTKDVIEQSGMTDAVMEQSVIQYLVGKHLMDQVKVSYIPYEEYEKLAEEEAKAAEEEAEAAKAAEEAAK